MCSRACSGLPYLLTLPGAFLVVALIGWGIERSLVRYLYKRPFDTMLATWGVSLILIQGVRLIFGADPKYIGTSGIAGGASVGEGLEQSAELGNWMTTTMQIGFFHLSWFRIFIFGVTIVVFVLTWYLMYRTNWGIKVRAVTQNKDMAVSHGINAGQVYGLTFAYGAGLAGVAGAMFGVIKNVFPNMGSDYIIEAFIVVVVGGVGHLTGSLVSAGALGEMDAVFSYFTNATFARFVLFIMVVIFLRFRPQGIFAEGTVRR